MTAVLRGCLKDSRTIDITGYDISLGKFDCSDNTTKTFDDFDYFIVPKDEFSIIGDRLNKLEEGRQKTSSKVSTKKVEDSTSDSEK